MNYIKSVLIVGGSGFVGSCLALQLKNHFKVFATYNHHPLKMQGVTYLPMNVDNRNWVKRVVYTIQPDIIIYVAGSNEIKPSRLNNREAERLHSVGPANIVAASEIIQPRVIYISNAHVFDGMKGNYHENDITLPDTLLGKMKLSGENFIRNKCLNYFIIRSSLLYGRSNAYHFSFMDKLRMSLERRKKIELSQHELHSFAPVDGLVQAIHRLSNAEIKNKIFHYGGLTKLSHYEFAQEFAKKFGYDPNFIIPTYVPTKKNYNTTTEEKKTDLSLNSTQLTNLLKIKPFILEEGLDLIQKKLVTDF